MTRRIPAVLLIGIGAIVIAGFATLWAQSDPLSTEVRRDYSGVRGFVIRSAEKMPESDYGFKPSPDMRSFAQEIALIADDEYNLCAAAKKESRQEALTAIENRLSKKAELLPALKTAFAYCDSVYDALTDASARETLKAGNISKTRFAILNWNLWHAWEHYGNIVVYLRMKGIVPPSSERRAATSRIVAGNVGQALAVEVVGLRPRQAQSDLLSADVRRDYRGVRELVIQLAEKMPEADYGFKPSPDVRSFAQQIAHIADDQYNLCAPAKNETRKAAYTAIESSLSKKAELVAALKGAFAYCDGAYGALTDASAMEVVKTPRTRFGMLNWNLWHTWEHCGNITTYLRIKGLAPPSSEKSK